MRGHFGIDWAFGIQSWLRKAVTDNFPQEKHRWPLMRSFDAEAFLIGDKYVLMVLRDSDGQIPSAGDPQPLGDPDAPDEMPSKSSLPAWLEYAFQRFDLRAQDVAMIIPAVDSGQQIQDDFDLWSKEDRELVDLQLNIALNRHMYMLKGFDLTSDFFIPPGYQFLTDQCKAFFEDHPDYDRNVFIMTRFGENRLLRDLDIHLRRVLRDAGMNPVRSDDKMYMPDRNLWNNVCVYMVCCKFGIAVLEDRLADEFNPNVALEYGFMRGINKKALLLADTGFRNLRADVVGTLRERFDLTDIEGTIDEPIKKWLSEIGGPSIS